jgi:hypothetical protein
MPQAQQKAGAGSVHGRYSIVLNDTTVNGWWDEPILKCLF